MRETAAPEQLRAGEVGDTKSMQTLLQGLVQVTRMGRDIRDNDEINSIPA